MAKGVGTAAYLLVGEAIATCSTVGAIRDGAVDLRKHDLWEVTLIDTLLTVTWPIWVIPCTAAGVYRVAKKRNNPKPKDPKMEKD